MRITQHIRIGLWALLLSVSVQGIGFPSVAPASSPGSQDGNPSIVQPATSPSVSWVNHEHAPSVGELPTPGETEVEDMSGASTSVSVTALHLFSASTGSNAVEENRFRRRSCPFLCVFLC